jgi:hypothetical protein
LFVFFRSREIEEEKRFFQYSQNGTFNLKKKTILMKKKNNSSENPGENALFLRCVQTQTKK